MVCRLRRVCRLWAVCSRSDVVWRSICCSHFGLEFTSSPPVMNPSVKNADVAANSSPASGIQKQTGTSLLQTNQATTEVVSSRHKVDLWKKAAAISKQSIAAPPRTLVQPEWEAQTRVFIVRRPSWNLTHAWCKRAVTVPDDTDLSVYDQVGISGMMLSSGTTKSYRKYPNMKSFPMCCLAVPPTELASAASTAC